jgi:hypothetical protein
MSSIDRRPLPNAPATDRIRRRADNRLGAVYSALYSFWSARHAAVTSGQQTIGARRDAYSVILFNATTKSVVVNDFTSSPDQLLDIVLNERTARGTNFAAALQTSQSVMEDNWSTERFAILSIFQPLPADAISQNTHHDFPLGWGMPVTGNSNPRSLSLRDPSRVGFLLFLCQRITLTDRLESRFRFMLLALAQMSLRHLLSEVLSMCTVPIGR